MALLDPEAQRIQWHPVPPGGQLVRLAPVGPEDHQVLSLPLIPVLLPVLEFLNFRLVRLVRVVRLVQLTLLVRLDQLVRHYLKVPVVRAHLLFRVFPDFRLDQDFRLVPSVLEHRVRLVFQPVLLPPMVLWVQSVRSDH